MAIHKIGDTYTAKYANPPVPPESRYPIGQLVNILDKDTGKRVAVFEVTKTDEENITGKIIVTYNHKRRGKCAS